MSSIDSLSVFNLVILVCFFGCLCLPGLRSDLHRTCCQTGSTKLKAEKHSRFRGGNQINSQETSQGTPENLENLSEREKLKIKKNKQDWEEIRANDRELGQMEDEGLWDHLTSWQSTSQEDKKRGQEKDATIKQLREEIERLTQKSASLEDEKREQEKQLANKTKRIEELEKEDTTAKQLQEDNKGVIDTLRAQVESWRSWHDDLESQRDSLRDQLKNSKDSLVEFENKLEVKENELDEMEEELAMKDGLWRDMTKWYDEEKLTSDFWKSQATEQSEELESLRKKIFDQEVEIDRLKGNLQPEIRDILYGTGVAEPQSANAELQRGYEQTKFGYSELEHAEDKVASFDDSYYHQDWQDVSYSGEQTPVTVVTDAKPTSDEGDQQEDFPSGFTPEFLKESDDYY